MIRYLAITGAALLLAAGTGRAAPPKAVETKEEGPGYSFEFSYPSVVRQYPEMQRRIEADRDRSLAQLRGEGKEWLESNPDRAGDIKLQTIASWQTVTDLPRWLSLTFDEWTYSGGAHGNWGRASRIWDKKGNRFVNPVEMFASPAAFDRVVQTRYCDLLDKERSQKRDGATIDRSQKDDWMQACPKPSELTLILGSSNGKAFNRLAVYAAPYAVGPYVEGDYEINLPVTPQLLAAVKPAYRASFALTPGQGKARR